MAKKTKKQEEIPKDTLSKNFRTWDRGGYVFPQVAQAMMKINPGKRLGEKTLELLAGCSICSVGNASCTEFFKIVLYGMHPLKGGKNKTIYICPHGCTSETCLLNK
jgi:hypothetical protein